VLTTPSRFLTEVDAAFYEPGIIVQDLEDDPVRLARPAAPPRDESPPGPKPEPKPKGRKRGRDG